MLKADERKFWVAALLLFLAGCFYSWDFAAVSPSRYLKLVAIGAFYAGGPLLLLYRLRSDEQGYRDFFSLPSVLTFVKLVAFPYLVFSGYHAWFSDLSFSSTAWDPRFREIDRMVLGFAHLPRTLFLESAVEQFENVYRYFWRTFMACWILLFFIRDAAFRNRAMLTLLLIYAASIVCAVVMPTVGPLFAGEGELSRAPARIWYSFVFTEARSPEGFRATPDLYTSLGLLASVILRRLSVVAGIVGVVATAAVAAIGVVLGFHYIVDVVLAAAVFSVAVGIGFFVYRKDATAETKGASRTAARASS